MRGSLKFGFYSIVTSSREEPHPRATLCLLLGLLFNPEDGGSMFLRNLLPPHPFQYITQRSSYHSPLEHVVRDTELRGFGSLANYADRATAASW
jgi:hypothetical protein